MATKTYIIQIPEPCKQDWHSMETVKDGRFCTHCSKSVTDFTMLSDEQIIALLNANNGKLCGRLDTAQLNRVLQHKQSVLSQNKLRKIFAAMLLLLTARQTDAYNHSAKPDTFIQSANIENAVELFPDNATVNLDTELSGTVLDSATRTPIAYITVENISTQKTCITDTAGGFKIAASIGDTIKIAAMGYTTHQFVVKNFKPENYILAQHIQYRTMGMMVRYKPTVKDTIKRFLGMK